MDPTAASVKETSNITTATAVLLCDEEKELNDLHWIRHLVVKLKGEFDELRIELINWLKHFANSKTDFTTGNQKQFLNTLSFAVLVDYEVIGKFADALMIKEHFEEALRLCQIIFAGYKGFFGADHPKTLQAQLKIPSYLFTMKEYARALDTNQKVYEILKSLQLGPNHELTITVNFNTGSIFMHQNKTAEARKILQDVYQIRIHLFGKDHPETEEAKTQLKSCLLLLEKEKEVDEFLETLYAETSIFSVKSPVKALAVFETSAAKSASILGQDHLETLEAMYQAANCYSNMKQFKKANEIIRLVYEKRKKILGPSHLATLEVHASFRMTFVGLKEYAAALRENKILYPLQKAIFGAEHEETLVTLREIAWCLESLKKHGEALDVLKIPLEKHQNKFGSGDKKSMGTQVSIARVMGKQGKFREASDVLRKLYERHIQLSRGGDAVAAHTMRILGSGLNHLAILEKGETLSCSICSVTMEFLDEDSALMFECTHIFHGNCIHPWARDGRKCPECRSPLHQF